MDNAEQKRVMAIASGGGHWQQLMRLRPAFEHHHMTYVTTSSECAADVDDCELFIVDDANRNEPLNLAKSLVRMLFLLSKARPEVVISTGAAPGLAGILLGHLAGAKTIWVDSIANAEEVSLSGRLALRFADVVLTQWSHLESNGGARYEGSVL